MTNYLTETRDGERKRGKEKGKTPTPTHLAQSGKPCKAREKKKRTDHGPNTDQRRGGRTEVPDTTYKARAKPTSAREGPKPDLERSMHELGDQWGTS